MRGFSLTLDVDHDLLDKRAKELFAIAIRGRRRRPHALDVFTEREDVGAFLGADHAHLFRLSPRQIHFGSVQILRPRCHPPAAYSFEWVGHSTPACWTRRATPELTGGRTKKSRVVLADQ